MSSQNKELSDVDRGTLAFMAKGGVIAIRVFGKKTKTIEIACSPRFHAGMNQLARLEEAGFVRRGDASPYKNGKSFPYVLTDAGKAETLSTA